MPDSVLETCESLAVLAPGSELYVRAASRQRQHSGRGSMPRSTGSPVSAPHSAFPSRTMCQRPAS